MRVHHLNCGTMRPLASSLEIVCHCLLIETEDGLALVDSGFGVNGVERPGAWLGGAFVWMMRPGLTMAETARQQVAELGYDVADVRHVILTHLDLDHAGGLADFPRATVHLHASELRAATKPPSLGERVRYHKAQWAHGPEWATYEPAEGEPWFGFEAVRKLDGLPEDILLIPLRGHTRGHSGIAVKNGDGWLLHAGDAYFHRHDIKPGGKTPVTLRAFQGFVQVDGSARHRNQHRLAELAASHAGEVTVVSAHDPVELAALA